MNKNTAFKLENNCLLTVQLKALILKYFEGDKRIGTFYPFSILEFYKNLFLVKYPGRNKIEADKDCSIKKTSHFHTPS